VLTRRSLEDWREYLAREQRNLKRMQQLIICEICYERPVSTEESQGFACKRHRFCEECWMRCQSCPLCRASKVGVHGDLWIPYYSGGREHWTEFTDTMMTRGLKPNFSYRNFRKNLANTFSWSMTHLHGPLVEIFSLRKVIRTVGQMVNELINFPIFTWKEKKHLEYDYERFQKIERRLVENLGLEGDEASAFSNELRKGLAALIREIKKVARIHNSNLTVSYTLY
jgi:hypothetical protein